MAAETFFKRPKQIKLTHLNCMKNLKATLDWTQ
ncbi:MAG: hypothetical protein WCE90_12705 [Candidatus Zixiibacteriota bacterium]